MNKRIVAALASGLFSCALAFPALADETPSQARRVAVEYGDLDLQTAAGQQALDQRLRFAARSVCPDDSAADLGTRIAGKRCVLRAVELAKANVDEQRLARAAGKKTPRG